MLLLTNATFQPEIDICFGAKLDYPMCNELQFGAMCRLIWCLEHCRKSCEVRLLSQKYEKLFFCRFSRHSRWFGSVRCLYDGNRSRHLCTVSSCLTVSVTKKFNWIKLITILCCCSSICNWKHYALGIAHNPLNPNRDTFTLGRHYVYSKKGISKIWIQTANFTWLKPLTWRKLAALISPSCNGSSGINYGRYRLHVLARLPVVHRTHKWLTISASALTPTPKSVLFILRWPQPRPNGRGFRNEFCVCV